MAGFRPGGMSSDEDSDDDFFESNASVAQNISKSFVKAPEIPQSALQNTNPSRGRGRGRGRGVIKIPWEEKDDDSWGTSTSSTSPHTSGPSSSSYTNWQTNVPIPAATDTNEWGGSISGPENSNRIYEQDTKYTAGTNDQRQIGTKDTTLPGVNKAECLNSIPHISTITADLSYIACRRSWNDELSAVEKCFEAAYKQAKNPLSLGLYLMVKSPDFFHHYTSRTFSSTAILQLKSYLEKNKIGDSFLDQNLQEIAFSLVMKQKKTTLVKLVVDVFGIEKIKDKMIDSIKVLSSCGQFKEACAAATALRLHCFNVHAFMIPLVLQDRLSLVEDYIESSCEMQRDLLSYLDELLSEGYNLTNKLCWYIDHYKVDKNEVKRDKLNEKAITKLIKRLAEKFKVDSTVFPNVRNKQQLGELRHLFHRRYDQKGDMNEVNFLDFIGEIVSSNKSLMEEAFYLFRINNDNQCAAKLVQKFNIPTDQIPHEILYLIGHKPMASEARSSVVENWEEDSPISTIIFSAPFSVSAVAMVDHSTENSWNQEDMSKFPLPDDINSVSISPATNSIPTIVDNIYNMPLGYESITIISSLTETEEFCTYIKTNLEGQQRDNIIAGFDAEWKPVRARLECAALLQIAFKERIFLIDIVALKQCETGEQTRVFENILQIFFANEKIFKLGYDFKNDMKMLCCVAPEWADISVKIKSVIDLHVVKGEISKRNSSFFHKTTSTSEGAGGLSELLNSCIQKNLSKAEQFSDWERRPLRMTQFIYAAADAYCLLEIFEFMKLRENELSIGLDEIVKKYQKSREQPARKPRSPIEILKAVVPFKRAHDATNDSTEFKIPRLACDVKIFCDNMLQGLGKLLRRCGINTEILELGKHCYQYIDIIRKDKRLVITKGKTNFREFSNELPAGSTYYVQSSNTVDQLEEVFGYFNVVVRESDSFTVCQHCNTNAFIKLSKSTVRRVLVKEGIRTNQRLVETALSQFKEKVPDEMIFHVGECSKTWNLFAESNSNLTIKDGPYGQRIFTSDAVVELKKIPVHLIDYIDGFYVCRKCGITYWHSQILQQQIPGNEAPCK